MPSSFDQYKTAFFGASSCTEGRRTTWLKSTYGRSISRFGKARRGRNSQCILTLRHRGRLYTKGVSGRIARTITVPPESGERARWKWLQNMRSTSYGALLVSGSTSDARPIARLGRPPSRLLVVRATSGYGWVAPFASCGAPSLESKRRGALSSGHCQTIISLRCELAREWPVIRNAWRPGPRIPA
jgi:hypothetical protein